MDDLKSFIRLQTWLSPAFPTGAFSYSHGLESAVAHGVVNDKDQLTEWLNNLLTSGPGWNDAVLLAESWRFASSDGDLASVAEVANALSFSHPRHIETTAQGSAFLKASKVWCDVQLPADCPLPVAVGAVAGKTGIDLENTLSAYLHAYVSNQIQAAMRLTKLGQQAGVKVLKELETKVLETARRAAVSTLDDLGNDCVMADIVASKHETIESRIFRS